MLISLDYAILNHYLVTEFSYLCRNTAKLVEFRQLKKNFFFFWFIATMGPLIKQLSGALARSIMSLGSGQVSSCGSPLLFRALGIPHTIR